MDRCIEHMDGFDSNYDCYPANDSTESRYVSDSVTNSLSVAGRQSTPWFFDQIFSFKRPSTYPTAPVSIADLCTLENTATSLDIAFITFSCTRLDTDVADNVASSNAVKDYLGSSLELC